MTIRAANPDDAQAIANLWNEVIRGSLATFTTTDKTDDEIHHVVSGPCLVAERKGQFAGFASFSQFRSGPGYLHTSEHNIYLSEAVRGQGYGRALLTELEGRALAEGIHVMVACMSSANPGAIAFHRAMGYDVSGTVPQAGRKWGEWLDLVMMHKRVQPGG